MNKLFLLLLLLFMPAVSGHLEGGVDVQQGNYIIDIGYDIVNLSAERQTVFLIVLHTLNDRDIESSSAWIRLKEKEGVTVFSGRLNPEPTGSYSFTTFFPHRGEYELRARFTTKNETIESFTTLKVAGQQQWLPWGGLLLASIIIFIIALKRRREK